MADKKPTVVEATNFNADTDANELNRAFKGFGTNENVVTSILACRSLEQRQSIQEAYKQKFEKDLLHDLRAELSGNYLMALEGLIENPADFHAKHVNGIVTATLCGNKDVELLEVLFPMNTMERSVVISTYAELYRKTLIEDVQAKVNGPFKDTVVSLLQNTATDDPPNSQRVGQAATTLAALTAEQWTPENNELMEIFIMNNTYTLFAICENYQSKTGKTLLEVASTQPKEKFRDGFKILVGSVHDHWLYYANQLHMSMKGLGTNDAKLIYIIVFRCEMDLGNIADTFQHTYERTLQSVIRDDTSGDYKNLLLALTVPDNTA